MKKLKVTDNVICLIKRISKYRPSNQKIQQKNGII